MSDVTGAPVELVKTFEADDGMRVSWFRKDLVNYVVWTYPGSHSPQMEWFFNSDKAELNYRLTVENWE